jgi:hypothetical protein
MEDVFIDDDIQMTVPKSLMPKPFLLPQVKTEPIELFEEQSTNIYNDIDTNDLVSIISNIRPLQIKREPEQQSRLGYLEKLLTCRSLDHTLQDGGLV